MSDDPKGKSKKPANTAFNQQRLKSWQPLLTPKVVLPSYFIVGLFFIPIGIALFYASENVIEHSFDYTNCNKATEAFAKPTDDSSARGVKEWRFNKATNVCSIHFSVDREMPAPIFMYYRLTNFYQNNRKYVKSFDLNQLKGEAITDPSGLAPECDPLRTNSEEIVFDRPSGKVTVPKGSAVIYPCGLIANSIFSDDLSNLTCVAGSCLDIKNGNVNTNVTFKWFTTDIAWSSDSERYRRSNLLNTDFDPAKVIPPPLWRKLDKYKNGYTKDNFPDISKMERFQVWMRTAGLPTFRKLWGRNAESKLPTGDWQIDIAYQFDPANYSGTKSIVISTVSVLGGKNNFLGIAYISVGVICWVLGLGLLLRHMIKPRKLGDHTYLSWNQPASKTN